MGFYERHVLPRSLHFACNRPPQRRQRERIVPRARGVVLEIGIGTGLNLPHYDPSRVERVIGLDPSAAMTRRAAQAARAVAFDVQLVGLSGEEIPLGAASVDTVLTTYTLCTIPDPGRALAEMRRVLKPGGELLFCEHGAAPDASVLRWQRRLDPIWCRLGGGCHLDRPIAELIERGGFTMLELEAAYIAGWRVGSFNYRGAAV